jgi:predicted Zn-dependent protease
VIEAADNEAQLAGVMAHETSHVALRHGTNQASKAYVAQVPLAILGGVMGNKNPWGYTGTIGADFATIPCYSSIREQVSQADEMGTQILYDSGYDPRAMGQFFRKIQAARQGGAGSGFFQQPPKP